MIKLLIFDLDGVLVAAKEMHYEALNRALESIDKKYSIGLDEHLSTYDGLPTTKKLQLLTKNKGLPENLYNEVWKRKQKATIDIINESVTYDERLRSIFKILKSNYKIAVCSNSIRETTKLMLIRLGLLEYIDFFYSNQDVINPKPNTEMFLKAMIKAQVNPNETLIIEDSHIGRKAVLSSGAYLLGVSNVEDVTLEAIENKIREVEGNIIKPKWIGGKMNVVIPMGGKGKRFVEHGYTFPKPLIDVKGKTMIQVAVDNLNVDAKHIFIVNKKHYDKYNLGTLLKTISPNCEIVIEEGELKGAAFAVLLAEKFIDNDDPLVIANCDQFIEWDSNQFFYSMTSPEIDGGILTFKASHPKWSYAEVDNKGWVTEVAEKVVLPGNNATVGVYYYSKGSDYVKYAKQMIKDNMKVNGEFYTCPVYNYAIKDGKKIKIFPVDKMWGIGTHEDLQYFLANYKGTV